MLNQVKLQIFDGQLTEEEAMAVAEGSIKDFVAGIQKVELKILSSYLMKCSTEMKMD